MEPQEEKIKNILHRRGALHIINDNRFYTEASAKAALKEVLTENEKALQQLKEIREWYEANHATYFGVHTPVCFSKTLTVINEIEKK